MNDCHFVSRKRGEVQNSAYSLPAEDSCRRTLLPAAPDSSVHTSLKRCLKRIRKFALSIIFLLEKPPTLRHSKKTLRFSPWISPVGPALKKHFAAPTT